MQASCRRRAPALAATVGGSGTRAQSHWQAASHRADVSTATQAAATAAVASGSGHDRAGAHGACARGLVTLQLLLAFACFCRSTESRPAAAAAAAGTTAAPAAAAELELIARKVAQAHAQQLHSPWQALRQARTAEEAARVHAVDSAGRVRSGTRGAGAALLWARAQVRAPEPVGWGT